MRRCYNAKIIHEIQGVRWSPLGVVEETKLRSIHDLTLAGSDNRSSVKDDTDFDWAPPCELGHVLRDVLMRLMYLRQEHGPGARIVLSRSDVKDVLRNVPVDPEDVPAFGYRVGNYGVVKLIL